MVAFGRHFFGAALPNITICYVSFIEASVKSTIFAVASSTGEWGSGVGEWGFITTLSVIFTIFAVASSTGEWGSGGGRGDLLLLFQ